MHKQAAGMGLDPKTDLPLYINAELGLSIDNDTNYDAALSLVEQTGAVLVALDSCEKITPSDKFTSKEFSVFRNFLMKLGNLGVAAVVIDHTRKKHDGDGQDQIYGGRSKSATADMILRFKGSLKDNSVTMIQEGVRGEAYDKPFTIKFTSDYESSAFEIISQTHEPKDGLQTEVMGWLEKRRGRLFSSEEIAEALGRRLRTVQKVLSDLVIHNLIDKIRHQQGTKSFVKYSAKEIEVHDVDTFGTVRNAA